MSSAGAVRKPKTKQANVRLLAQQAIARLLEPLTGFVMDSGMSIQEFGGLLREAAVHGVAAQQLEVSKRVNISGIAAATGISRADVSKILKAKRSPDADSLEPHQQSTNKILSAWNQDPKFTAPNGQPADLKIYGRGASFDALVKSHGRGIPTRAMLDELLRAGAIELRPAQAVRLKTTLPVNKGLSPRGVKAFGEQVTELMTTLLHNMRHPDDALFIARVSGAKLSPEEMPLLRKEVIKRGSDFLTEIQENMIRRPIVQFSEQGKSHGNEMSVTIYLHEFNRTPIREQLSNCRRNFRRRP